MTLGEFPQHCC